MMACQKTLTEKNLSVNTGGAKKNGLGEISYVTTSRKL
jgi:hypothetical protein